MVFGYIQQENLGKSEGSGPQRRVRSLRQRPIKMNDGLLDALWKTAGGQKKDQKWPEEELEFSLNLPIADMILNVIVAMTYFSSLFRAGGCRRGGGEVGRPAA